MLQVTAQTGLFVNGTDASLRVDSNAFIYIRGNFQNQKCDPVQQVRFSGGLILEGSFINNDSLVFFPSSPAMSAKAKITFINNSSFFISSLQEITGTVRPDFWQLECNKGTGAALHLNTDIVCLDTLSFSSGLFYINNRKVFLKEPVGVPSVLNHPYLKNERQGAQFFPSSALDTGLVIYQSTYQTSLNLNPANLGIEINGVLDIGSPIVIKRGFAAQVNAGKNSLLKYFDVHSPGHSLENNTVKIRYTLNDMSYYSQNYFSPPALRVFASPVQDMNWGQLPTFPPSTLVLPNGPYNGILNATLADLRDHHVALDSSHFRITIADPNCVSPPQSALLADTIFICSGKTVTLDAGNNTSIPNTGLRYSWHEQGSALTSHLRTTTVTPTTMYRKINLLLSDVRGCMTRDSVVIAPAAPFPMLTYLNHLNSCLGDSVTFKDTVKITSGTYTNTWQFNDNAVMTGNARLFRKKFQTAGSHAAQVTSTSNHGCSTVATLSNIIVYPPPTAAFVSTFNCQSEAMHFTNTSVPNHTALVINSQKWNFGTGQGLIAGSSVTSHPYPTSGIYSVQLHVTTNFGCKDSVTVPIMIYPKNSASFTKHNACPGDPVSFQATGSCLTGSCSYQWNIGNQSSASGLSINQLFFSPGTYPVKLKVTAPLGCPDSTSSFVIVHPQPNTQFSASASTLCADAPLYLQNTSTISSGVIAGYSWSFGNNIGTTNTNAAHTYTSSGSFTVTLSATSDSGCVNKKQTTIVVHPKPWATYQVNNVCEQNGSLFVSNAAGANYIFLWDYGNALTSGSLTQSTHSYTYPLPGTYTTQLNVYNQWGCSDIATQVTTVYPLPVANLGGTINTCGTSYILNANNPGCSFYWLPSGQTTSTINALNNGQYIVQMTSSTGCINSEKVNLILNAPVAPDLGNDTTVCGSIALNAGYPGSGYQWNNGNTNQTQQAFSSGLYHVTVTDQNGCIGSDSINILVKPLPTLNLGPDLVTCYKPAGLLLSASGNASQFLWNNGSTASSVVVNSTSTLWLTAMASNGCTKTDTIKITVMTTPAPALGSDRSSCGFVELDAMLPGYEYLWSTGDTTKNIKVTEPGIYVLQLTNPANGCKGSDTVGVTIFPIVNVDLPGDTSICENQQLLLDAKNPGSQYHWTDGSSTQTVNVKAPGFYAVTVTNHGGCSGSDQLIVQTRPAPKIEIGSPVKYLCAGNAVAISSNATGKHTWTSDNGFNSIQKNVQLSVEGNYKLEVEDLGCISTETFAIVATGNSITASFLASTQDTVNKPVQFINLTSPKPVSQLWHFGDGTTSTEENPVHTYLLPQDYHVTLEVNNGYCSDQVTKSLHALFRLMKPVEKRTELEIDYVNVYPNPTNSSCKLDLKLSVAAHIEICVTDLNGKTIFYRKADGDTYLEDLRFDNVARGLYIIRLIVQGKHESLIHYTKLVKTE